MHVLGADGGQEEGERVLVGRKEQLCRLLSGRVYDVVISLSIEEANQKVDLLKDRFIQYAEFGNRTWQAKGDTIHIDYDGEYGSERVLIVSGRATVTPDDTKSPSFGVGPTR